MPLERFFKGEEINVKDLTIENPETEEGLPFDPEKEITDEDWKRIKEFLDGSTLETYLPYAGVLQQVFPEKAKELELGKSITDARLQPLVSETKREQVNAGIEYGLRVLFPDGRYSGKIMDAEAIKRYFTKRLSGSSSGQFLMFHTLGFLIFANPEDIKKFTMDQQNITQQEVLKRNRERYFSGATVDEEAHLKLLPCQGVSDFTLTADDWGTRKEVLKYSHERNKTPDGIERFIDYIAAMKILVAKEVKMTEHGLEIVMRKPKPELETKTPPLPETRNF